MNLDKKLELAHEWAMEFIGKNKEASCASNTVSYNAWQYADAMEAEYNKRHREQELKTAEISRKIFDALTKNNIHAYMNCDIQVVDENGDFRITTRQKELDAKEWQPDWSVAPETAIEWFMIDDGRFKWRLLEDGRIWYKTAPSFNYQGDWKDSLRKRP